MIDREPDGATPLDPDEAEGYQVIKKWLSYREKDLLGRALQVEEAREVTHMARRIAAVLLLERRLDDNYRHCRDHTVG